MKWKALNMFSEVLLTSILLREWDVEREQDNWIMNNECINTSSLITVLWTKIFSKEKNKSQSEIKGQLSKSNDWNPVRSAFEREMRVSAGSYVFAVDQVTQPLPRGILLSRYAGLNMFLMWDLVIAKHHTLMLLR